MRTIASVVVAGSLVSVPALAQERTFLPAMWQEAWQVAPTMDSFLISPSLLTADGDGFLVFDYGDSSIKRIARGGELAWSSGRSGQGPGEFTGALWLAVHGDTIWHSSADLVTVLTNSGKLVRTFKVQGMLRAVPVAGGGIAIMRQGSLFREIDGEGGGLREWSPPGFPEDLTSLEREALPSGGDALSTMMVGFVHSGSLAFLDRDSAGYSARMVDGIEPFDFGRVVSWTLDNGVVVTRVDPRVPEGALGIGQSARYFHVFFMGATRHRGRLIDLYDRVDGKYAGSLLLPETVRRIGVAADGSIAGLIDEPVSHLKVWRWTLPERP